MKYRARIASREISSEQPYIVYSHTDGVLATGENFEEAKRFWTVALAQERERGKESDCMLFGWRDDHWALCGSLYDDLHPASFAPGLPDV